MAYPQIRASIPSAITRSDFSSQVCTFPTGLTAGDLLVLYVGIFQSGADRTITTPSGWTLEETLEQSRRTFTVFKKVATSGDVSAGSVTVSFSGLVEDGIAYACFAITGAATGSEITLSESDTQSGILSSITDTTALTPLTHDPLVLSAYWLTYDSDPDVNANAFSLTPSSTVTERVDIASSATSGGVSLLVGSSEYGSSSQITSRSVTLSVTENLTSLSIILLVNAPQNATADISHLAITPTVESLTGSNTATATIDHIELTPTLESLTATSSSDGTQWTNDAKNSTTWTNEDKSS